MKVFTDTKNCAFNHHHQPNNDRTTMPHQEEGGGGGGNPPQPQDKRMLNLPVVVVQDQRHQLTTTIEDERRRQPEMNNVSSGSSRKQNGWNTNRATNTTNTTTSTTTRRQQLKNDNNNHQKSYHWPEVTFSDHHQSMPTSDSSIQNLHQTHLEKNMEEANYSRLQQSSPISGKSSQNSDNELLLNHHQSTLIHIDERRKSMMMTGNHHSNHHSNHHHHHLLLQLNREEDGGDWNQQQPPPQQQQPPQHRKRLITNESGDSIEESSTTNSSEKKKPVIPDGGYGWVVVFASLVVSLIADGLSFSFGLINTQLLAYFGESPSKTAWISSLFFSVPLLMGPIWSNLVDKYGCRKMTMIGGLVSGIGFGLSSFCNSIEMLMVTFGIISGLGLGIGYVTAVVSIAFWFDKKRTFATGIGASGTGIGTFLYAPLTQWLIDSYGWRGATLILASTMLNTCVCGALMRDPDWLIEENRLESRSQSVTTFSDSSVCLKEIKKLLDTGATKEYVLDTLVTKNNTEANQQLDDPHESIMKRYRSEIFLPTYLIGSQDLIEDVYEVKSLSRRSLRQRDGVEAPSKENLLSLSLSLSSAAGGGGGGGAGGGAVGSSSSGQQQKADKEDEEEVMATNTKTGGQEHTPKRNMKSWQSNLKQDYYKRRTILASAETLSPSEKEESQWSIEEKANAIISSPLPANLNLSRRSLNDNLMFAHYKDLIREEEEEGDGEESRQSSYSLNAKKWKRNLRYNSLDVLLLNPSSRLALESMSLRNERERVGRTAATKEKVEEENEGGEETIALMPTRRHDDDDGKLMMMELRYADPEQMEQNENEMEEEEEEEEGELEDMMTIIDVDQEVNADLMEENGGATVEKAAAAPINNTLNGGLRRFSRSKKLYYRSNLRRNISIRNSNFLKDMRIHRNSIHYRGAILNTHRYRLRASSCPNIYRNSMTTIAKDDDERWYNNWLETINSIFDVSLFKDMKFTLFNLSTLSLFIWFIIPYLYLPEYMKTYSYETTVSAQLISAIGVAQTIGMIGLGYLGDRPWMNVNVCYSGCMIVCGLSVGLMPLLMKHYYGILSMCIIFGFTFASSFSFTPSILVSIVDLDDFTCAYGLVLLVQGIGMIAGPPIAGMIYELTLSWDDAFYYAGIFIILSGILSYLIEFCEKRKEATDTEREGSETRRAQIPLH